jgi:proteasome lid subunit RPN8/RPN11
MKFTVSSPLAADMFRHGAEGFPAESCGFLVGRWDGENAVLSEVVRGQNTKSDERNDYFEIDPRQYNQVEKELRGTGKQILGFYHSHPNHPDIPSFTDLSFAQGWPGFLWTIIQVVEATAVTMQTYILSDDGQRFVRVETVIERLLPPDSKRDAYLRMEAELAIGNG